MSKPMSILLDLLRVAAAGMVLAGHLTQPMFSRNWPSLMMFAHAAVSIFFVLSGFVISYVTESKEKRPEQYVTARVARLYSVLVVALALSAVVTLVAARLDPGFLAPFSGAGNKGFMDHEPVLRFVLQSVTSLVFLNSIHGHEFIPGVDNPMWSLSFEAAYYSLFGIVCFCRGHKRILLVVLCCAIFGTGMLRLLPAWLAGVGVQRLNRRIQAAPRRWRPVGVISLIAVIVAAAFVPYVHRWLDMPHGLVLEHIVHGQGRSLNAGLFYYWSAMTSLLLIAASCFDTQFGRLLIPLAKPIRWSAKHTFSLYLFHFPLLVLIVVTVHYDLGSNWQKALVAVAVLGMTVLLSKISEDKKLWWRAQVHARMQRVFRVHEEIHAG